MIFIPFILGKSTKPQVKLVGFSYASTLLSTKQQQRCKERKDNNADINEKNKHTMKLNWVMPDGTMLTTSHLIMTTVTFKSFRQY